MPFSATFTLTIGSSASVGPFSIVGQPGSEAIASSVSRADLAAGQTYHNISDTVTSFDITSSGTCGTSINVPLSSLNTYTFQAYCSQNSSSHPIASAPAQVVFTGAELGFTPVGAEFISIGGSGNVDFVFQFTGAIGDAETLHSSPLQLNIGDFTCDGQPI